MTNEESEVTWITPVIPKTWVPCFHNIESVTDIVSNPKDLDPIWRTSVFIQIEMEIEWLGFGILQKNVMNTRIGLSFFFLFLLVLVLFLALLAIWL
jgi:hypothetical protein